MLNFVLLLLINQLDHFGFVPISSPQIVGDSFSVTIYAYDANNNIYPYQGPALLLADPGPEFGSRNITFSDGVWQGSFVTTLASNYSLRCQDFTAPPHTGLSNEIAFNPNIAARLLSILPGQTYYPGIDSGTVGIPTPQPAGNSFNVTVYLTDQWCNRIFVGNDEMQCLSTDQFIIPQTFVLTNGSIVFSYAFRTANSQRLYLFDLSNPLIESDTSSWLNVYPGPFSDLLVILPGETHLPGDTTIFEINTPGKVGEPDEQYVLENFSVFVYATDSMWNKVSTSGQLVTLRSNFPPLSSNPLTQTIMNGETEFLVYYAQDGANQNIWAESGTIHSYLNYIDIVPKAVDMAIMIEPDTISPGATALITATVYGYDQEPLEGKYLDFAVLDGHGYIFNAQNQTDSTGTATADFGAAANYFNELNTIGITVDDTTFLASCFVFIQDSSVVQGEIIAFPNPMGIENQHMRFVYFLPVPCDLIFAIYDPFGNLVYRDDKVPGSTGAQAGLNQVEWNGHNGKGRKVASGIYYVIVKGYTHTETIFENQIKVGVIW